MAGTIICDYIRTDANKLSLNVGNVTFATINANGFHSNTGVQIIDQNGVVTLRDGQITPQKFGFSGAVLRTYSTYGTSSVSVSKDGSSSGTNYADLLSLTITPTYSTSKFILIGNSGGKFDSSSNAGAGGIGFDWNGTKLWSMQTPWYPASATLGSNYTPPLHEIYHYQPGNTNTVTVKMQVFAYNESGGNATQTVRVPTGGGEYNFTILELAA